MQILKIIISVTVISLSSYLAKKYPGLAGFIIALPISTLLVLALTQLEYQDPKQSTMLAKSIFLALPLTLIFFVPFLMAEKWKLSFWICYISGMVAVLAMYPVHNYLLQRIFVR